MTYRNLTKDEINALTANGNSADDWGKVMVDGTLDTSRMRNNTFCGEVRLGKTTQPFLTSGNTTLPTGVANSMLRNCTIGDNCVIRNVHLLEGYTIGDQCLLFNIDEMSADPVAGDKAVWMEPMNENGGRKILPFNGMTIGDAYMWARFRGEKEFIKQLENITRQTINTRQGGYATVGDCCTVKNCKYIKNVAIRSLSDDTTVIEECIALCNGVVGSGCHLQYGIIAERFLLGEHVHLEYGLRLNDSVVGDNSTLARCEVGCSIIFPSHEQHHNNSFLIAALVMGQSNVAAGGTIGSNHNSRTADNEIAAGRGFWPGLCVSLKHSSRFASNCLLAKGDYPAELNITLPFALVNNNVSKNQLEVMPAYWWMYNMYAMDRNSRKFAARDKRVVKAQHIEFNNLAPDTAEEIIIARDLLYMWTEQSYREGKTTIEGHGMEKGKRKTVILKAGEGYEAYRDMLVYYAMQNLADNETTPLPTDIDTQAERVTRWVNIGGQLVAENDIHQLIEDVKSGVLNSWDSIHSRINTLWGKYPEAKRTHAYKVLCHLSQKKSLDNEEWSKYKKDYQRICQYVADQKKLSRKKDDDNDFRRMTYWNDAEMHAVLD